LTIDRPAPAVGRDGAAFASIVLGALMPPIRPLAALAFALTSPLALAPGVAPATAQTARAASAPPAATQPAQTQPAATQPAATRPAELIEFTTINIDGATLHLQKELLPKRETIIDKLEPSVRELQKAPKQDKGERLEPAAVVDAVNRMYGLTDQEVDRQQQIEIFRDARGVRAVRLRRKPPPAIWVASRSALRSHYKAGGSLPRVEYDVSRDRFRLSVVGGVRINRSGKLSPYPTIGRITLPYAPDRDRPIYNLELGAAIDKMTGGGHRALPIHELAEWTLTNAALEFGNNVYARWFTDGVADAVALRVLRELGADDTADGYWALRYDERFDKWRDRANLEYWPRAEVEVRTPFKAEESLWGARYGFAAYEMKRLLDEHGKTVLAPVIDRLEEKEPVSKADIIKAINRETGVGMGKRLASYNAHETEAKAIDAYQGQYLEAANASDREQAISALIRLYEIRMPELTVSATLSFRRRIAKGLLQAGHAEAARRVMTQLIPFPEKESAKQRLRVGVIMFAVMNDRPELAYDTARDYLKHNPEGAAGLVIRAHRLAAKGKTEQARALAQRLLDRPEVKETGKVPRLLRKIANAPATQPAGDG
jgi:hypothetical protein